MILKRVSETPLTNFECIYLRESFDGFELVAQQVTAIGDDFHINEIVLLSAPTPHPLIDSFRTGAVWELLKAKHQSKLSAQ